VGEKSLDIADSCGLPADDVSGTATSRTAIAL
jgi:hypothetical protein